MKNKVSPEVQTQAMKVAKGNQKPGQTKEQTKLIAQGIEKGIAEYKKQQNQKLRAKDKQRKQALKVNSSDTEQPSRTIESSDVPVTHKKIQKLPWILLLISWGSFITYFLAFNS